VGKGIEIGNEMKPWPLMGAQVCMNRSPHPHTKGHEPMDNLPWQSKSIMQAEGDGRRMEVRVCKYCGCLYYECWEVSGGAEEG